MKPLLATVALLTLTGCVSKNIQTKEAVRQAVLDYLTASQDKIGITLSAMNVEVGNMSFQQDRAQATVAFNLKSGEGGMQMLYEFERSGEKWVVKGRKMVAAPGEAPAAMPPGHPPTGEMPAGHPPVAGAK